MSDVISREEAMAFPNTWKEFEEEYGFTDEDKTYTNGSRLIPSFRVEQWLEHIARPKGKWIAVENDIDYYPFMCSECHETIIKKTNYCPRCGAKMLNEVKE